MTDRRTADSITDDELDALYAERDRYAAVIRRIDQMATAWQDRLPEVIRTPAVVAAIRAALEPAQRPIASTTKETA